MTTPASGTAETADAGVVAVLAAAEATIAAFMLAAYTKWLADVTTRVLAGFTRFAVAPDPAAVWATVPLWERQIERLMFHVKQIARAGWIHAADQLGVDVPFDPDSPILADQLQRTRNLMVRTPDEVYRMVITELGKAHAAGEGPIQQAARVRHVLDVTGVENWPARAKTVAVTEVHRAWNMGALAASMRAQQKLRYPLMKRWNAKDDARTRPAHERADGQTVPINQPFLVDSVPLMVPGDPAGPPHLVINCRCKPIFTRRR